MSKQAVLFSLLLTPFIFAGMFFYADAHAGEEHSASYNLAAIHLSQDESVTPESLGVDAPSILPGHPFYFFKNLSRGVRSIIAFGDKKAELKLQFANEKIIEAQILLDRGEKSRAAEHLKSYEKDLARAIGITDKKKFIIQSFRHQGVIDKIEKEAGEENSADIKAIREKIIEHIAEVVLGIQDKEEAKSALIEATSEGGGAFKPLRNLEILKAVEEKVPEQAKEAIRAAQENAVKRFKSDYDKGTEEEKAAITEYIIGAGGDASRYMEVFSENKEILGVELFKKLLSAGEDKKSTESAGPAVSPASSVPAPTFVPKKKTIPTPIPKSTTKPAESVTKSQDTSDTDTQKSDSTEPAAQEQGTTDTQTDEAKPYQGSPPLLY